MSVQLEESSKANASADTANPSSIAEPVVETATGTGSDSSDTITTEELKISGDALVVKIKELIHQGNVRRIIIKHEDGHPLIEIPLTVGVIGGVIGAALFPVVAAVGVIGAMVAHLTIVVERQASRPTSENGEHE